jgi:hypothetical protein
MIVQDGLRLDGGVVTDGRGPVGFARAKGGGRFGDGHRSAHTLVGQTGVGALETVANADVAGNVVRKMLEQPHRVHRGAELASKDP